jgi:phosphohistidine phosphatase
MKTLLLLRHAKSSWKDESLDDHDRPLNDRGKKEAPRMGQLLLEEHLLPDIILSSDAKRCRRTVEKVCDAAGYRGETMLSSELYLANPATYLKVLARLSEEISRVLVVGHNPGLEELLETLVEKYEPMTTAALAHIRLANLERWADLDSAARGELVKLWQPMELA